MVSNFVPIGMLLYCAFHSSLDLQVDFHLLLLNPLNSCYNQFCSTIKIINKKPSQLLNFYHEGHRTFRCISHDTQ